MTIGSYAAWQALSVVLLLLDGGHSLVDFGSFYASGLAARQGLDPFGSYPLTFTDAPNLNAPLSVPLFAALTVLPPEPARALWFVVSCLAYGACIVLLLRQHSGLRHPLAVATLLGLSGVFQTLAAGQMYAVLGLLVLVSYQQLERRPLLAAVLLAAVVAVKPNLVVVPVLLVFAGRLRLGFGTLGATAAWCALPAALYGPGVYRQWFATVGAGHSQRVVNASLLGALARLDAPAWAGPLAAAGLLAGLALWAWRVRPEARQCVAVGLVAALLSAPLAWVGYMLLLVPLAGRLRPNLSTAVTALLLLLPSWPIEQLALDSPSLTMTLGQVYTAAFALLLVAALRTAREDCVSIGPRATQVEDHRAHLRGAVVSARARAVGRPRRLPSRTAAPVYHAVLPGKR